MLLNNRDSHRDMATHMARRRAFGTCLLLVCFGISPLAHGGRLLLEVNQTSAMAPNVDMPVVALEQFAPLAAVHEYLCAFHVYADNGNRQVQAHHYCSVFNNTVHQCVLYDNNTGNARLMGIEYLIPADMYQTLPTDEQQLWHSHIYEVKSGMLQAPGLPKEKVMPFLQTVMNMYGKTWHTWQVG